MRIRLFVLVALFAAACGSNGTLTNSGTTNPSPNPSPTGPVVNIVAGASSMTTTAFSPNPLTLAIGSSVTWINGDTITHTSVSDNGTWNSGNIAPGASFTRTFSTAGSFSYHCAIHPNMVATLNVQ